MLQGITAAHQHKYNMKGKPRVRIIFVQHEGWLTLQDSIIYKLSHKCATRYWLSRGYPVQSRKGNFDRFADVAFLFYSHLIGLVFSRCLSKGKSQVNSVKGRSSGVCVKFFLANRCHHFWWPIHQRFTLRVTMDPIGQFVEIARHKNPLTPRKLRET